MANQLPVSSRFEPGLPFDSLPLLPPQADIESRAILRKTTLAARALSELKSIGALIPNQEILVGTIPLLEAQVSSEIENIITTNDKLFRAAANEKSEADSATKEALRYARALRDGYVDLGSRPLNMNTAVRVCQTIRNAEVTLRTRPGTKVADGVTGKIIYTPPDDPGALQALVRNWEAYLHGAEEADPLIKMAILHYQFEAIHPFTDGNGRTGRILNILYLIQEGLLKVPVLYLSRYILQNRADYYRLLRAVTEDHAWEAWILYILDAIEQTAQWTSRRIFAIRELAEHTREFVIGKAEDIYSRELVDLLFIRPYVVIQDVVQSTGVTRQTASRYLKRLVNIGVLVEHRVGNEKYFGHPKFLELLMGEDSTFPRYTV